MTEENVESKGCNLLKDPISWIDLVEGGTNFEINTDFDEGFINDIFDELNPEPDTDDDLVDISTLVSPWTKTFAKLREEMTKINEHLYKKITAVGNDEGGVAPLNALVRIRYNAYWEGESTPFDSSYLRGSSYQFYTGRNEVLEGLEAAVLTMHRGEHAQFVISYEVLFREMGCPPRVKPCADGLFIIELLAFNKVGDNNADQQLDSEERNKFSIVIGKVKEMHVKGRDLFGRNMYKQASFAFKRAVDVLNYCRLANEEEQTEQTALLIKLYTNLSLCYLKVNAPSRTCLMCREIKRLTDNKPSCKALFYEGRALLLLGEYSRARQILLRAQNIEPHNVEICNELKKLETSFTLYKQNEKMMWSRAMSIINPPNKSPPKCDDDSKLDDEFECCILEIMESFKNDLSVQKFNLPSGLTDKEIKKVADLATCMEIRLTTSPNNKNQYVLHKA